MTRFLSRVWDDPLCGRLNEETDRLFAYHQATKHTYQSVRQKAHYLDWKNQPSPFRVYEGAPITLLPHDPGFPATGTFATIAALEQGLPTGGGLESIERGEMRLDLIWLSRFLWHCVAISAWKKVPGSGNRYSLRVNPSSGNLHPTETYLALRGFVDIEDGLYHYRADCHALELRSPGAAISRLAQALRIPWARESPLLVGLTSIFWREAWKYRERGYRYCCHDLGHAMMATLLAARALGLPGGATAHFSDACLTRALGLTGGDEAPMAFLVFPALRSNQYLPPQPEEMFSGIPNELSPQETPYELLLDMHRATILPDAAGPLTISPVADRAMAGEPPPAAESFGRPVSDAPLGTVVRRRRSALDFDARTTPMQREHLEQLLDFATRDWAADWRGTLHSRRSPAAESAKGTDFITLYLFLLRVRDFDPGVYRWDRGSRSLKQLHPGNVERVAAYLSLEQALAGNSCFTVSMIADLAKAAQIFGNRGYRYVHFEAGAIGQRLYLGAEALHWNATGIGAFYDDDVHRYLGFLEEADAPVAPESQALEHPPVLTGNCPTLAGDSKMLAEQVVYHFAVGRAVSDPRLDG